MGYGLRGNCGGEMFLVGGRVGRFLHALVQVQVHVIMGVNWPSSGRSR